MDEFYPKYLELCWFILTALLTSVSFPYIWIWRWRLLAKASAYIAGLVFHLTALTYCQSSPYLLHVLPLSLFSPQKFGLKSACFVKTVQISLMKSHATHCWLPPALGETMFTFCTLLTVLKDPQNEQGFTCYSFKLPHDLSSDLPTEILAVHHAAVWGFLCSLVWNLEFWRIILKTTLQVPRFLSSFSLIWISGLIFTIINTKCNEITNKLDEIHFHILLVVFLFSPLFPYTMLLSTHVPSNSAVFWVPQSMPQQQLHLHMG